MVRKVAKIEGKVKAKKVEKAKVKKEEPLEVKREEAVEVKREEKPEVRSEEKKPRLGFFKKLSGILFSPRKTLKELSVEASLGGALKYYLFLLLILSAVFAVMGALTFYWVLPHLLGERFTMSDLPVSYELLILLSTIFFVVGGLLSALVSGIVLHIFVRIFAGKGKSIKHTIQAVMYACTPVVLFWWVPPLNVFTPLWSFILAFFALKGFHQMSNLRTILVMVSPFVLVFILTFLSTAL